LWRLANVVLLNESFNDDQGLLNGKRGIAKEFLNSTLEIN
jgi:hypothetical protein